MVTISLCMIVKNEEDTIARCLDSVFDIVDEVIVVDTGSTDNTEDIVRNYTDKVYHFKWIDDFSAARNYSFSKATQDYIFWMDADDVLLEPDRIKFKELKQTLNPEVDVVIMKYNMSVKDKEQVACTFMRERLVKRSKEFEWIDPIHEYINFSGKFMNSEIAITHKKIHPRTRRNLEIFEKAIEKGHKLSERNWFYYAKELFADGQYDKAAEYYEKFVNTKNGLLSNYLDACIDLSTCYKNRNDDEKQLKILLKAFEIAPPRPEVICQLGYYFKDRHEYDKAISWFELAPVIQKPENTWSAVMHYYWNYIPYMELVACYYKLGNIDKAIYYNEKASEHHSNDDKILHNRVFLAMVKQELVKRLGNIS